MLMIPITPIIVMINKKTPTFFQGGCFFVFAYLYRLVAVPLR